MIVLEFSVVILRLAPQLSQSSEKSLSFIYSLPVIGWRRMITTGYWVQDEHQEMCKVAPCRKHAQIAPWHNKPILGHRLLVELVQTVLTMAFKPKKTLYLKLILNPISSNAARTDM